MVRSSGMGHSLGGIRLEELRELVEPAGKDKPELQVLCRAFEWLIQDACHITVRSIGGQNALFEANKKEADKSHRCHSTVGWASLLSNGMWGCRHSCIILSNNRNKAKFNERSLLSISKLKLLKHRRILL